MPHALSNRWAESSITLSWPGTQSLCTSVLFWVHERILPNQFLLWAQLEACQRDFPKEPGRFRQAPDCPKAISREQEAGASKSVAERKIMSTANIKVDDDPSRFQKRERGGLLVQMLHMQTTLP